MGSVPAAEPSTYIESGTVASEMLGASVAPTIEPVAKMTARWRRQRLLPRAAAHCRARVRR